jgi:hypothetical protein
MGTQALLIPANPDEQVEAITLQGGYQELQRYVGGTFDVVRGDNIVTYCHDEGLLIGLEPNLRASLLCNQLIVGDVVVVGSLNVNGVYDGENHDVPADLLEFMVSPLGNNLAAFVDSLLDGVE